MRIAALFLAIALMMSAESIAVELEGHFTQGGLLRGKTTPGASVTIDGRTLRVSPNGDFVFGFGRDAPPSASLRVAHGDGKTEERVLQISPRKYKVQRIDGLPKRMVTPPKAVLARIKRENASIAKVRARDTDMVHFLGRWARPAKGVISGVYGSQRILNGKPRQPHFGLDFAAPVGAPVVAPADGVVVLAHSDMYYTGVTLILDHGHGVTSAFLHLSSLSVKLGERVRRGQRIAAIGATGRVTGPHLDWRINWFERRIDPAFLIPPEPKK